MARLNLEPGESLYYEYQAPTATSGRTFVFFNAITGDLGMWEGQIAPALRAEGHGTLSWNLRGQDHSETAPDRVLDTPLVVADAQRLLDAVKPPRPVYVGLSIGGLYGARAHLNGNRAEALVLINTLRRNGPRLQWINEALFRCAQVGGTRMLKELFAPRLFNEEFLAENRDNILSDAPYEPLPPEHGHYRLLRDSRGTDWELPYEQLDVPVTVITGLEDGMFYDRNDVDRLIARIPNARRVDVPNAGHILPAERPQVLIRELIRVGEEG